MFNVICIEIVSCSISDRLSVIGRVIFSCGWVGVIVGVGVVSWTVSWSAICKVGL